MKRLLTLLMIGASFGISAMKVKAKLELAGITITHETYTGKKNGSILVKKEQIKGGSSPYMYSIGTAKGFQHAGTPFKNLISGSYTITLRDANKSQVVVGETTV